MVLRQRVDRSRTNVLRKLNADRGSIACRATHAKLADTKQKAIKRHFRLVTGTPLTLLNVQISVEESHVLNPSVGWTRYGNSQLGQNFGIIYGPSSKIV
jgi:hypothetical protein